MIGDAHPLPSSAPSGSSSTSSKSPTTKLLFSERNSSGNKCLVMKQFLSADQLDEIEEIIEMKVLSKFKQYDSGSKQRHKK